MRLVSRNDRLLLGGLAVALAVVFVRPLGRVLTAAQEIDEARGIPLLPVIVVLTAVALVHVVRRRGQVRSEARAAAARASELELLVAFGHALARSLEIGTIRTAAEEYLPRFAAGRSVWVLIRPGHQWVPMVGANEEFDVRARMASRALGEPARPGEVLLEDRCFPMVVAGVPVGVMGIGASPPPSDGVQRGLVAAAALLGMSIKNAELLAEVRDSSARDPLTTCFTKRHATEVIDGEIRRARRSRQPLTLVMLDLDHFKAINDRFGHPCGDAVLASVGQRLGAILRGSDVKCRYGGDEFLLLLPDTPLSGAQKVAETIRTELENLPVSWRGESIAVTASFGLAEMSEIDAEVDGLVARADVALYRAKQAGRNTVEVAAPVALA